LARLRAPPALCGAHAAPPLVVVVLRAAIVVVVVPAAALERREREAELLDDRAIERPLLLMRGIRRVLHDGPAELRVQAPARIEARADLEGADRMLHQPHPLPVERFHD